MKNEGSHPLCFSLSFRVHCSQFFPQSLWVCVWGGMSLPRGRPTWHAVGTGKVRPGGEERELPEQFLHTAPPATVFFSQFGLSSLGELLLRRTLT